MQDKQQTKPVTFMVYTDIYLKSSCWALLLLFNFGVIAFGTFYVIFNVIRPSYENAKAIKEAGSMGELPLTYINYEKQHLCQYHVDFRNIPCTGNTTLWNGLGTTHA
ncbi:MAG: hypothetical protein H0X62_01510 [Bacteroidetes bacterium]|nr:hypothetical protein [Bacteroidota bacterium]